jgi:transcriptional regulator with XRE-family HTH domain
MAVSRRISEEEVQRISWRMKSARMLTGLTQENFAQENDISLTSLKCWEMGRAVPRQEGVTNYLNAVKRHGIDVSFDWIFYGSGPGPTYLEGTQLSKRGPESNYLEEQIKLFQDQVRSKGLNPIILTVSDACMDPYYAVGDVVGGYYVALDKVLQKDSSLAIHSKPWLLGATDGSFILRFLVIADESNQIFYRENNTNPVKKLNSSLVGRVCWHHRQIE